MLSLITILISLVGYGTPTDYTGYTEAQLNQEIAEAQAAQSTTEDGTEQTDGGGGDWDQPSIIGTDNP